MPLDKKQAMERVAEALGTSVGPINKAIIANLILAIQTETAEECAQRADYREVSSSYHQAAAAYRLLAKEIRTAYSLQAGDTEGRKS
jgi:hypothetical protein